MVIVNENVELLGSAAASGFVTLLKWCCEIFSGFGACSTSKLGGIISCLNSLPQPTRCASSVTISSHWSPISSTSNSMWWTGYKKKKLAHGHAGASGDCYTSLEMYICGSFAGKNAGTSDTGATFKLVP